MAYSDYISNSDLIDHGYDTTKILNNAGYNSSDDASNDFLQDIYNHIYTLILRERGATYTIKLFSDFLETDNQETYSDTYNAIKNALIYQAIFILENGDASAKAKLEDGSRWYSDLAITELMSVGVLRGGR